MLPKACIRLAIFPVLALCLFSGCENDGAGDALDPGEIGQWIAYGPGSGLGDDFVWNIYEDGQGNIWAGTGDAGARRFDGSRWTAYTTSQGMLSNSVYSVCQDADGDMWFGTGGGLNFLIGGQVYYHEYFLDIPITALFMDSRDRMWMGTYGDGIYVYLDCSYYHPAYFTENEGYNYINSITEDTGGRIWFATEAAAIYFDGQDFYIVDTTAGLYSNDITFIMEDSWGDIWFCGFYGRFLTRYDGLDFEKIYLYHGYNISGTFAMAEDLDHNLWFMNAAGGIVKYNGIEMIPVKVPESHADESFSCGMADSRGNLWLGGMKRGILVCLNP